MATASDEQRGALIGIAAVVACMPGVATIPPDSIREIVDAMVEDKPGDEDKMSASAIRTAKEILAAAHLVARRTAEAGERQSN